MKRFTQILPSLLAAQLALFGVPLPGDPFWTEETLRRAQTRYPSWDLRTYRAAMRAR